MTIDYRICTTNEEYEQVKQLEMLIWDVAARDAITFHTMHILTHTGGVVLGAFDGEMMVGMAVGFATHDPNIMWSHMAGVHPAYQSRKIGYQLKQEQRAWALKHGYTEMRWSFDPAMRRNAHFNFHILGVTSNLYHENFYGDMTDALNKGVPSDRFEAIWQLEDDTLNRAYRPDKLTPLLIEDNQQPKLLKEANAPFLTVAIPYDYTAIKKHDLTLAAEWRFAMREVLHTAFAHDYQVVDFVTQRDVQACYYVLKRDE